MPWPLGRPTAGAFDFPVHGVVGQIDLAGPGDGAIFEIGLFEQRCIRQRCKAPGVWRDYKPAHVDDALKPIEKPNPQPVIGERFDEGNAPAGFRHDGRDYGSGSILSGAWF